MVTTILPESCFSHSHATFKGISNRFSFSFCSRVTAGGIGCLNCEGAPAEMGFFRILLGCMCSWADTESGSTSSIKDFFPFAVRRPSSHAFSLSGSSRSSALAPSPLTAPPFAISATASWAGVRGSACCFEELRRSAVGTRTVRGSSLPFDAMLGVPIWRESVNPV